MTQVVRKDYMTYGRLLIGLMLLQLLLPLSGTGAEPLQAEDENLQDRLRSLSAETNPPERLKRAHSILSMHRLSSLQVKNIAARLADDAARYDFAVAAYPRTIDPENFYEVYDAFTTLSKVMRLHDHIGKAVRPKPGPVMPLPPATVSNEAFQSILQSLRKEAFDQTRSQLARQILTTSDKRFLSRQIQQMVECFDFESNRLELAKFAYDYVQDREMYFLVNDGLEFDASKATLSRYIQSRSNPPNSTRR